MGVTDGPFNFIGNTMADWKMRQLLRLLEAGGKVTVTIEIPPKGETRDDADERRAHETGTSEDSESDDASGDVGGEASE